MKMRDQPAPLSINVALGGCCVVFASHLLEQGALLFSDSVGAKWSPIELGLAFFMGYQIVGLARLSRWPAVFQAASTLTLIYERFVHDPHWPRRAPWIGMAFVILPPLLYFILTLPHWRKMNWSLLGQPYRSKNRAPALA
jgi:hypothetical protein